MPSGFRELAMDLMEERDPRFEIGPSTLPDAGHGLFAKAALEPGDRLEVVGVLIAADSQADRCTVYADRYKFRVGDRLLIPVGFAGLVNHSNTPNLEKVIERDRVYLRVVKHVDVGEELTFRYSEYAQGQFAEQAPGLSRP